MFDLAAPPVQGRIFDAEAVVRLGDSSPGGRARLDALARMLQDVSDDDARDAGFGSFTWVVRRTVIVVGAFPTYLERLALRTWCAGFGAAWAERRISVVGDRGGRLEAATLWVHLDARSKRPARLPDEFLGIFGPSAAGRKVSAKGHLGDAPTDAASRPWPLRFTDFDVLDHVNNAVYWEAIEEELALRRDLRAPLTALVEHGAPIERHDQVEWCAVDAGGGFNGWLRGGGGEQFAAVQVRPDD